MLEPDYPGRVFVVITLGRPYPQYEKFELALKMAVRPVLVSFERLPFRDFAAEEFMGGMLLKRLPNGRMVSVCQGSGLTLGQLADACVYAGNAPNTESK